MQAAESALFKGFHVQSRIFAELLHLIPAVHMNIAFTLQIYQRYLSFIAEPSSESGTHSHIAQYKSAVRTEDTVHAVEEVLRIRI
jgi:hypothetical protein